MVGAMMGSPPQWSPLCCASAEDGENKLYRATCVKRFMCEIPMEKRCNSEDSNEIRSYCNDNRDRTYSDPKNGEYGKVQSEKRYNPHPVDMLIVDFYHPIGVEPVGNSVHVNSYRYRLSLPSIM
jgi:hypothetical protein